MGEKEGEGSLSGMIYARDSALYWVIIEGDSKKPNFSSICLQSEIGVERGPVRRTNYWTAGFWRRVHLAFCKELGFSVIKMLTFFTTNLLFASGLY